jgi:hypothetical protein
MVGRSFIGSSAFMSVFKLDDHLAIVEPGVSAMNLTDLNSIISSLCAIISSMGAVGSVLIANRALVNWRKEMKGRTHFEIGRKMLVASRNVRDAFFFATSRSGKLSGEAITNLEVRAAQVRERLRYRLQFLREQMQELEEATVDVEMICERKVEQHVQTLRVSQTVMEVDLMDSENDGGQPGPNDSLMPDVLKALQAIEEEVKPLLKAA